MPRVHNKVSDGLENFIMDQQRSRRREFAITFAPTDANPMIIQSDGGRRSEKSAASALIVGLCGLCGERLVYEPWKAQGLYIQADVTVFQTGAVALEAAIDITRTKLQQFGQCLREHRGCNELFRS